MLSPCTTRAAHLAKGRPTLLGGGTEFREELGGGITVVSVYRYKFHAQLEQLILLGGTENPEKSRGLGLKPCGQD